MNESKTSGMNAALGSPDNNVHVDEINGHTIEIVASVQQFNFARHWRTKIAPILADRSVVHALAFGMLWLDPNYEEGDPPWELGRGPLNGQRAKRGCLSWYQPWGRCHYIAPFVWTIGKKLFPEIEWGFISSDLHTVVIGHRDDWNAPEWVMDILLFRDHTAQQSLDFAKTREWKFYPDLRHYFASFHSDPEEGYELLSRLDLFRV